MRWNVAGRDRDLAYQIAPNRVKFNQKILYTPATNAWETTSRRLEILAPRQVGGNELVTGTALIQQTL